MSVQAPPDTAFRNLINAWGGSVSGEGSHEEDRSVDGSQSSTVGSSSSGTDSKNSFQDEIPVSSDYSFDEEWTQEDIQVSDDEGISIVKISNEGNRNIKKLAVRGILCLMVSSLILGIIALPARWAGKPLFQGDLLSGDDDSVSPNASPVFAPLDGDNSTFDDAASPAAAPLDPNSTFSPVSSPVFQGIPASSVSPSMKSGSTARPTRSHAPTNNAINSLGSPTTDLSGSTTQSLSYSPSEASKLWQPSSPSAFGPTGGLSRSPSIRPTSTPIPTVLPGDFPSQPPATSTDANASPISSPVAPALTIKPSGSPPSQSPSPTVPNDFTSKPSFVSTDAKDSPVTSPYANASPVSSPDASGLIGYNEPEYVLIPSTEASSSSPTGQPSCPPYPAVPPLPGKKGMSLTMRDPGEQGSWVENMPKLVSLNPYWSFSWSPRRPEKQPPYIEFVPMIYGAINKMADKIQEHIVGGIQAGTVKRVLGFNEPDSAAQSNLGVQEAIDHWPLLQNLGVPLVSPSAKKPLGPWMQNFAKNADRNCLRMDWIGVHWYANPHAEQFKQKMREIYRAYGKRPLLITEFAPGDWKAETSGIQSWTDTDVLEFMKQVLPWLEKQDWIVGYAWFPYTTDGGIQGKASALFDENNNLTALGRYYASVRTDNPNGDDAPGGIWGLGT